METEKRRQLQEVMRFLTSIHSKFYIQKTRIQCVTRVAERVRASMPTTTQTQIMHEHDCNELDILLADFDKRIEMQQKYAHTHRLTMERMLEVLFVMAIVTVASFLMITFS